MEAICSSASDAICRELDAVREIAYRNQSYSQAVERRAEDAERWAKYVERRADDAERRAKATERRADEEVQAAEAEVDHASQMVSKLTQLLRKVSCGEVRPMFVEQELAKIGVVFV